MVPSRGRPRAALVLALAARRAEAKRFVVMRISSPSSSARPWMNWARMAPELPRAPARAESAAVLREEPRGRGPE